MPGRMAARYRDELTAAVVDRSGSIRSRPGFARACVRPPTRQFEPSLDGRVKALFMRTSKRLALPCARSSSAREATAENWHRWLLLSMQRDSGTDCRIAGVGRTRINRLEGATLSAVVASAARGVPRRGHLAQRHAVSRPARDRVSGLASKRGAGSRRVSARGPTGATRPRAVQVRVLLALCA
jgi:hypothetical protein